MRQLKETMLESLHSVLPISAIVLVLSVTIAPLDSGVLVLFGVITTENIEQAIERAGSKAGNKGYDCALSAIEMVNLKKQL